MFKAISHIASRKSVLSIVNNKRAFVPLQRSFFSKTNSLEEIRESVRRAESNEGRLQALSLYVQENPAEASRVLHAGIMSGKFVGKDYVKQYILSLVKTNSLESVDINTLISVINKGSGAADAVIQSYEDRSIIKGQQSPNGDSPANPIYVQTTNASTMKTRLIEIVLKFILSLIIISVVIELISENLSPGAGGLGKTKSAIHQAESSDKTFDDVIGIDEAKEDLKEIVMYLKNPRDFTRLGGNLPRGVLLTGPPGTGKTLLARAIAGEANVPFFYSSGSEFEEMFVGVGAKRVRELFQIAKSSSPCIIFIDEIDAIGGKRNEKDQSAHRMTLNQLLVEMDGFDQNNGVIVIAATNFSESLDPALIRPGRFDKRVDVPTPDIAGRKAILEHYASKVTIASDVDIEQLARGTPGFTGADLSNLVNQAAVYAAVKGFAAVGMAAFEFAKDKILMGAERRSAVISPKTMKNTAYHEAGHALVALLTDGADPVHKATIMPRGRALGMVMQLPDGDQTSLVFKEMLAKLDVCMGGRVAEDVFFGKDNISSGASSDIEQATRIARAMVARFGLSPKIGPICVDDNASQKTKDEVDEEVKRLLNESYARTKILIESHRQDLEIIANGLLEYESLSGADLANLLKGIKPAASPQMRSQKASKVLEAIPTKAVSPLPVAAAAAGSKSAPLSKAAQPVKQFAPPVPPMPLSAWGVNHYRAAPARPSSNGDNEDKKGREEMKTQDNSQNMKDGEDIPASSNDNTVSSSKRQRGPPRS